MKSIDYRYIRAWGQLCGQSEQTITDRQIDALLNAAPIDAIYIAVGRWRTIKDIHHIKTRHALEDLARQL